MTRPSEGRTGDLSVLTKDVRIVGDVETAGRVRLEGTVTGNVRARSIELSGSGTVEGDVVALSKDDDKETFVVEGTVKGAVRARHVEIGEGGSVQGGIEADHATVRGKVKGGIQARDRLSLKSTAVVEGDIDARRLALEEGGQVNGNIRIGDRAALKETPTAATRDKAKDAPTAAGRPSGHVGIAEPEKARASA